MAQFKWGKVYFKEEFAGILQEIPQDRYSFEYDEDYLTSKNPPIAYTLPKQKEAFISSLEIHPFFDNLVAEGWMEKAQTRLLGKHAISRFELLLAFGADCAGAVSVIDPSPETLSSIMFDKAETKELSLLTSRASLSGVQPKLAIVERNKKFYPSIIDELSTHIAKFPSHHHPDLVSNEYLTTLAFKALLPHDSIAEYQIAEIVGFNEPALIVKRFDRENKKRIHFEEFNSLLGLYSHQKYDAAYKQMAEFIVNTPGCLPAENYRLYQRILAGLLLGNTDMHLKNFALFHTAQGFRLTPAYDEVAASLYGYKTLALTLAGASDLLLGNLKPSHLIRLGLEFNLSKNAIEMAIDQLGKNRGYAKEAIDEADFGNQLLKKKIIELMEKRWNGTFALIGKHLSKKP